MDHTDYRRTKLTRWSFFRFGQIFWAMSLDDTQKALLRWVRVGGILVLIGLLFVLIGTSVSLKSQLAYYRRGLFFIIVGGWLGLLGSIIEWRYSTRLRKLLLSKLYRLHSRP